jgi:hypothetical protein
VMSLTEKIPNCMSSLPGAPAAPALAVLGDSAQIYAFA